MSTMQVSVVIPTSNRPEQLRVALASVAAQRYPDLEIIVVDDSSSPAHQAANAAIASEAGPRARYIFLPADGSHGSTRRGPSVTRNLGLQMATGELVGFCDDDDRWTDVQRLSLSAEAFAADGRLDLQYANQETRFRDSVVRRVWQPALVKRLGLRSVDSGRHTHLSKADCLCLPGDFAHLNTCIYRRDFLLSLGGLWSGVQYSEDLDIFVRTVDAARAVSYLDLTVAVHNRPDRTRRDNASTQIDAQARSFALLTVAVHLLECCRSSEALTYARELVAQECRKAARFHHGQQEEAKAWVWARLGLGCRLTPKWVAFAAFLWMKKVLREYLGSPTDGPSNGSEAEG